MRTIRHETGLYLLALTLGVVIRLIGLGALPLSDSEAAWALQALNASSGTATEIGSQPAYVALTSALFFAFGGATNALARLVPALAGSALILVPSLFRERLKPRAAVILAFALALEPGLAAISRQAGSSILAVTFTLAAWGLWEKRHVSWAGICAGAALLSGPALWVGSLGFAITWALLRPFESAARPPVKHSSGETPREARTKWITAGTYALGTIVVVGTLFARIPGGVSAWIASLPDYVSGWMGASDMPMDAMAASLVAYQPLAVLLALKTGVRGWVQNSLRVRRLSLWMVVALLLALFYPSRQVVDLAWMLIPMWALASLELARNLQVPPGERREVLGVVGLIFVILAFVWLDYLALIRPGIPRDQMLLRTWLLLGSFILLIASLLLVGFGWSMRVTRYGTMWGLAVVLGMYGLGALMGAAGHRTVPNSAEMWRPGAQLPMAALVLDTVDDQSAWSQLDANSQPVTIAGIDSPALRWLLRDRPIESRSGPGGASNPPMVITPDQPDSALAASYRGQSFVWRRTPVWRLLNLLQWLPRHETAFETETVILWVRIDLFPDAKPRSTP